jgi:hypothetical protein
MKKCHVCREEAVAGYLGFGAQPVCNRFLAKPEGEEYTHPLTMGVCRACGLVQLTTPVPAHELTPPYDWISYNEPEGHLDRLADIIARLPGLMPASIIAGLTYKDDSTIRRLRERGFANSWRVDPQTDLGLPRANAGVEAVQDRVNPQITLQVARTHGRADVLLVRHILEHAHDMPRFLAGIKELAHPDGYVIFEMPDATRALERCDYSAVWEEHVVYFTPETIKRCFAVNGLDLVHFESFPYSLEDSLVGIVRPGTGAERRCATAEMLAAETGRALRYFSALDPQRQRYQNYLADYRRRTGKVALLGAGHLACTFINLLGLKDQIEFMVDDNPHKTNLFMPGSRLPIRGSASLLGGDIRLCLMSVSPESESKVIDKNQGFVQQGGTFASIFPDSCYSLPISMPVWNSAAA